MRERPTQREESEAASWRLSQKIESGGSSRARLYLRAMKYPPPVGRQKVDRA